MRKILSNRNFLKLWIGQVVSNIGDEVAYIGLAALIVFKWEGSALDVSLLFISTSLPVLIFGPIAGVYVDRWRRKNTMIWADLLRAGIVFLLIFPVSLWYVLALIFLLSSISRFFYPARNAMIPNIVKEEKLIEANSLSQMTYMLAVVIGPAIGAFLVAIMGYTATFIFDAASYIFSALMILTIKYREEIKRVKKRAFEDLMDGLRYLVRQRVVVILVSIFALITLVIGGLNVVYTLYIRDILHMDIVGLSMLEVAFGVGAIAGAVSTGTLAGKVKNTYLIGGAIVLMGTGIISMSLFPVFILVTIMAFGIGFGSAMINGPVNAILQKVVEDEYRGKVFGALGALIQGAALISMGMVGILISIFGIMNILLASGLFLLGASLIFLLSKRIKELIEVVD